MSYKVNDLEFQKVLLLPPNKRYSYFIKKIVDFEEIWGLFGTNGWALSGTDEKNYLPLWPADRYAQACASGNWKDQIPSKISLNDFMKKWIPGLKKDEMSMSIFPDISQKGVVVTPDRLLNDIYKELDKYDY